MHHFARHYFTRRFFSTRAAVTAAATMVAGAALGGVTTASNTSPPTAFVPLKDVQIERKRPSSLENPTRKESFPPSWDKILSPWQKSFLTVVHCEAQERPTDYGDDDDDDDDLLWKIQTSDSHYYEKMPMPKRGEESSHVIFGQLMKPGLIDRYVVYRRVNVNVNVSKEVRPSGSHRKTNNKEVVVADIHFGTNLDGHLGIVHGGVISLIFDDAMGFAYESMGIKMAVTANLAVNFRAPVPAGCEAILRVNHSKSEGRKLYFEAQLTSLDGETLYAEGTSLYIVPRSAL